MINRNVETKESQDRTCTSLVMQNCVHNNILLVQNITRNSVLNPFTIDNGTGDPMVANSGSRIGDQITLKGMSVKMMLENPIDRCNSHYRIMLIKGAKGETFSRDTLFKGDSTNKLMDMINTECFTIIAQKIVNLKTSNGTSDSLGLTGVPGLVSNTGIPTKLISRVSFGDTNHVHTSSLLWYTIYNERSRRFIMEQNPLKYVRTQTETRQRVVCRRQMWSFVRETCTVLCTIVLKK
jgi:hypothetical protein